MKLNRHQLAYLSNAAWCRILEKDWDEQALACLLHWRQHGLPLVVTRQPHGFCTEVVSLGLPAPGSWGHRKLATQVPRRDVLYFDQFPSALNITSLLPCRFRQAWRSFCADLLACGGKARIHGSYGWQKISGLDYLRPSSDIDLCIAVGDEKAADAVARVMDSSSFCRMTLDGEIMFDNGMAVSCKEWQRWREGKARSILVKCIAGPRICNEAFWQRLQGAGLVAA